MQTAPPFPIIDGKYKMEKEPVVRIGVILAEDGKTEVQFTVPADRHVLLSTSLSGFSLRPGVLYVVRVVGGMLELGYASGGESLVPPLGSIRIVPPAASAPKKAGDGTLVKGIVAGRGFHWHKLIDQTLSDVLDFSVRDGRIVLVNELPLETYLTGVITGEMSGECPIEFMKAQAIAARSWLLGQPKAPHPGQPFLWCNDDCCQRYQGTGGWSDLAIEAIRQCRGEVLITRTNHYCDARYSKSTGTVSEDAENVWGSPIEGLVARLDAPKGSYAQKFFPVTEENLEEYITGDWIRNTDVFCSAHVVPEETIKRYLGRVDETGQYFRWEKSLSQADLRESLVKRGGIADLAKVVDLRPLRRGRSGRINKLEVVYTDAAGRQKTFLLDSEYNIRAGLSVKFLYSGCFIIHFDRSPSGELNGVHLKGAGWGHGAGLCQIGGLGRALSGQKYDEILLHYYSDVRLERIYS
jgi:stage II sporulation protein D